LRYPLVAVLLCAGALCSPLTAFAAQIRAYVAEFGVTAPEPGNLKSTLQTLFTSRIAGEGIVVVGSAAEAEVIFTGSYTQLGKTFSLDATAKLPAGRVLATAFDQGEGEDALLPALGRVSGKLRAETVKMFPAPHEASLPAKQPAAGEQAAPQGNQVWLSQRIPGEFKSIAPGRKLADGREFFVAGEHSLRLYRQDSELSLLAEATTAAGEKVLALDSTGPDKDGNLRAYLTIMKDDTPSSRIYSYQKGELKIIARDLPYLFRSLALYGGEPRICAQQLGHDDFYGPVYEVAEAAAGIELKKPIVLPRSANLFSFNMMRDPAGASFFVVLNEGGFLIVYSAAGEELWRSSETFGGSETFFPRHDKYNEREMGAPLMQFIDQRITVTKNGEIVVPQNSGSFVIGNVRSLSKHSIVSLAWNGSSLEERGRTKQSNSYLADYFFEPRSGDLVLLEVVQKEGIVTSGASVIRVVRYDK